MHEGLNRTYQVSYGQFRALRNALVLSSRHRYCLKLLPNALEIIAEVPKALHLPELALQAPC